jgi:hypothetical protein
MSAVTIDMTVVVTQKNLAICWKTRVSDSTHLEALPPSSENLFSADNQQATRQNKILSGESSETIRKT